MTSGKLSPTPRKAEGHGGRHISAGGVLYRRVEGDVEVVLIAVKNGKIWGLPKGLQEDHESLALTAHREVEEETGLSGRIIEKLGRIGYFYTWTGEGTGETRKVFKNVYFFLMEYTHGELRPDPAEVDDARWFLIDEAISLMSYDDERDIIIKAKERIEEIGRE